MKISAAALRRIAVCVGSLILIYVTSVILYRWGTWHFVQPFITSLWVFGAAPIIVGAAGAIAWVIDRFGLKGQIRRVLKIIVVDSPYLVFGLLVISAVYFVFVSLWVNFRTPPKWTQFVLKEYLRGEQDQYKNAIKTASEVRKIDENAGSTMQSALHISAIMYRRNHNNVPPQSTEVEPLISVLSSAHASSEPLRLFAVFAAADGKSLVSGDDKTRAEARAVYQNFSETTSRFVPSEWSFSARIRLANTYTYAKDFQTAEAVYENLLSDSTKENPINLRRQVSIVINIVQSKGQRGDFADAIEMGNKGLQMLQGAEYDNPKSYFSLVENIMMCQLTRGTSADVDAAITLYDKAVKRLPSYLDESSMTTYILALVCAKNRSEEALQNFRKITDQMTQDDLALVGLYDLEIGHRPEAIAAFRSALKVPQDLYCSDKWILESIKDKLDGWIGISLVTQLLNDAEQPSSGTAQR